MARIVNIAVAVLVCCAATAVAADQKKLVQQMALFDKALIPAYFATKEGAGEDAGGAVSELQGAWESFKSSKEMTDLADDEWPSKAAWIDSLMGQAARHAADESRMADAHNAVAEIRNVLKAARQRNDIRYILDIAVEFERYHGETIRQLAHGEIEAAREIQAAANGFWVQIGAFRLDKIVYGLDYYALGEQAQHYASASAALARLDDALAAADTGAALEHAREAGEHFIAYYKTFGRSEAY